MPAHPKTKTRLQKRKDTTQWRIRRHLGKIFWLGLGTLFLWLGVTIYKEWNNRIWLPQTRITIAVATDNPTLYSYDPQTGEFIVMEIPGNTQIETSYNLGSWFVGSLWDLGWQKGQKGDILASSLQRTFSIPVDGWIEGSGQDIFTNQPVDKISAINKLLFAKRQARTNLSFFDIFNLLLKSSSTRSANFVEIDPEGTGMITRATMPDGVEGYLPSKDKARVVAQNNFRDSIVSAEGKTVSIINTTQRSGLAKEVAGIITVLGTKVVEVQTRREEVDNCVILGKKEDLKSITSKKLEQVFNCTKKEQAPQAHANLEILLGTLFAERF